MPQPKTRLSDLRTLTTRRADGHCRSPQKVRWNRLEPASSRSLPSASFMFSNAAAHARCSVTVGVHSRCTTPPLRSTSSNGRGSLCAWDLAPVGFDLPTHKCRAASDSRLAAAVRRLGQRGGRRRSWVARAAARARDRRGVARTSRRLSSSWPWRGAELSLAAGAWPKPASSGWRPGNWRTFSSHGAGSTGPASGSVVSRTLTLGASHASSALAALPAGSGGPSAPGLAGAAAGAARAAASAGSLLSSGTRLRRSAAHAVQPPLLRTEEVAQARGITSAGRRGSGLAEVLVAWR